MTNYEKHFGYPERAAKALSTVTAEDGIYITRAGEDEPMTEVKWLEWLQEKASD